MASGRRAVETRRPVVRWVAIGLVVLVLAAVLWIVIRGLIARDALTGAVPLVQHAREAILDGDSDAALADLADVQQRAATAAALTSDPVWRVGEIIPFAGQNLTAFREAAAVIDAVAHDALPPLAQLATDLDFGSFVPHDGVLDTEAIVAARPLLDDAATAMARAAESAAGIHTESTVPQIGEAVDQLIGLVEETDALVSGVAGAAQILPAMLGEDGPRDYLLLVQNNAELRAAGGIPGALAVIHAEDGRLTLGQQSGAFPTSGEVALPLTDMEQTLYNENLGLYMQNVTLTPDFARTGELAQKMWSDEFGVDVDGVLSVDPVALSYILEASGPISVSGGIELTASNAVEMLLSETYARFPDTVDQDAFFAAVAAAVFHVVAGGDVEPKAFIDGLVRAGSERRLLVWSANDDEQQIIGSGSLSGPPPGSTDDRAGFGVYFNDNTGAKMDYYLRTSIAAASIECRNDDRPYYQVTVELTSTVTSDLIAALPEYVSGPADLLAQLGLVRGQIQTTTFVYAPAGSVVYDVRVDDIPYAFIAADDERNAVAGLTWKLDPGETAEITYSVLGPVGSPLPITLEHTPTAFDVPTDMGTLTECPTPPADGSPLTARAVYAELTREI